MAREGRPRARMHSEKSALPRVEPEGPEGAGEQQVERIEIAWRRVSRSLCRESIPPNQAGRLGTQTNATNKIDIQAMRKAVCYNPRPSQDFQRRRSSPKCERFVRI